MRSSPSSADPLDPGAAGFAHRGLHSGSGAPENSLAAFDAAIAFGAGIECDLRLTADHQAIVFHDVDASRLCGNPLKIRQSSWEDVRRLRVSGHPIPRLEELLDLAGGRVPLVLEVKVDHDRRYWAAKLRPVLSHYSGLLGLMSFDPGLLRLLKGAIPTARRGLVITQGCPALRRRACLAISRPDFLAVELGALAGAWVRRGSRPVYGWTVRTPSERAQAGVQADALIWEADGRPRI